MTQARHPRSRLLGVRGRRRGRVLLTRAWRVAWAAPNSALGLLVGAAVLLGGGQARRERGVLEIFWRPTATSGATAPARFEWPFAAVTLGHVVIADDQRDLNRLRQHERVHVRQYERWGPLFLPAYALSSLWQWINRRHPYWDNRFEVEAYAKSGGRRAKRW